MKERKVPGKAPVGKNSMGLDRTVARQLWKRRGQIWTLNDKLSKKKPRVIESKSTSKPKKGSIVQVYASDEADCAYFSIVLEHERKHDANISGNRSISYRAPSSASNDVQVPLICSISN